MLVVVAAAAVIGVVTSLVIGSPFAKHSVTKADIERAVAKKPRGRVNLVLCNAEFIPTQTPQPKSRETWTCDTYLGRSLADQRNGPSYEVIVDKGSISSIRRVPAR
jgi:Na+/glutamate symporter